MSLLVGLGESLVGDVRINLGGGKGSVTKNLLDCPQVGTMVQEMSSCRVPQGVGAGFSGGGPS